MGEEGGQGEEERERWIGEEGVGGTRGEEQRRRVKRGESRWLIATTVRLDRDFSSFVGHFTSSFSFFLSFNLLRLLRRKIF